MKRRDVLLAAGAAGLSGLYADHAFARAGDGVEAAHDYAYTPWEFARAAARSTQPRSAGEAPRFNIVNHRKTLSDHTHRQVTAPNNDTIYSSAFLDLSGGPLELSCPSEARRYFSVAFMNLFTDNFFYIGTRATGGEGGRYWIVGPGWRGAPPEGAKLIRSDTNDVWMLARVLVDGEEDLPNVHAFQERMLLNAAHQTAGARPIRNAPGDSTDPANLLAVTNEMLGRSSPLRGQARRAREFQRYGVSPGLEKAFGSLPATTQQAWREVAAAAPARLMGAFRAVGGVVNGWAQPPRELGDFGRNDALRAAVARGGLAALGRKEAMYFSSVSDSEGRALDGGQSYRITVPATVPVKAFWSLTMYQAEPDGRFFFVDNPIRRYSIGDRTRGLARNPDGSLDLWLQREAPPADRAANWLPLPAGPWRASFRAYLPGPEMIAGRWSPPALIRV